MRYGLTKGTECGILYIVDTIVEEAHIIGVCTMPRGRIRQNGILTTNQAMILVLLVKGLTYPQIAVELNISRDAVEAQLVRVRERLHAKTTIEAVVKAIASIDPGEDSNQVTSE